MWQNLAEYKTLLIKINMIKKIFNALNFKKISILLILALFITSGASCSKKTAVDKSLFKTTKITIWAVYENEDSFNQLFGEFKKLYPTVSFEFRVFESGEYEKQLLNAWAENRGPDIYFIPNSSIGKYISKITPLPEKIKLPYRQTIVRGAGMFQKTEIKDSIKEERTITPSQIKDAYAEVVYDDVVFNNKIYGLPLSIETLAMFYNRDITNGANIATPPVNWNDFVTNIKKITLLDEKNNFIQNGTAMGSTKNIDNGSDIALLLVNQNGINTLENNNFNLGRSEEELQKSIEAIKFFNDFANPIMEVYSWNDSSKQDAFNAFTSKRLAYYFGYPHKIKEMPKTLNYGIAKVPQINKNNPANFADYWVMTVSHQAKNSDIAWGFINFINKQENAKIYLSQSKKPSALRSLIDYQKEKQPELIPFLDQILSAHSWYKGKNPEFAKEQLKKLIEQFKIASEPKAQIEFINKTLIQINQDRIN